MISPWPILLASLVGSPHCGAMCGMIAGAAGRSPREALGYHGARLAGYLALGALGGLAGATVDRLGAWSGFTGLATRIAGAGLILFGLAGILAAFGRGPRLRPSGHGWLGRFVARGRDLPPARRAALLGLATALLPCGWLFAFATAAAGTADPIRGASAMAVFWLGTVPAVAGAGWLVARVAGPLRTRLPALAGAAMIVFGLLTVFGRFTAPGPTPSPAAAHDHRAR